MIDRIAGGCVAVTEPGVPSHLRDDQLGVVSATHQRPEAAPSGEPEELDPHRAAGPKS